MKGPSTLTQAITSAMTHYIIIWINLILMMTKAYQEPYINYATKVMLEDKMLKDFTFSPKKKGYAIKVPVFSFNKFPYSIGLLGMKGAPKHVENVAVGSFDSPISVPATLAVYPDRK